MTMRSYLSWNDITGMRGLSGVVRLINEDGEEIIGEESSAWEEAFDRGGAWSKDTSYVPDGESEPSDGFWSKAGKWFSDNSPALIDKAKRDLIGEPDNSIRPYVKGAQTGAGQGMKMGLITGAVVGAALLGAWFFMKK